VSSHPHPHAAQPYVGDAVGLEMQQTSPCWPPVPLHVSDPPQRVGEPGHVAPPSSVAPSPALASGGRPPSFVPPLLLPLPLPLPLPLLLPSRPPLLLDDASGPPADVNALPPHATATENAATVAHTPDQANQALRM